MAKHYLPMIYEVDLFLNRWWEWAAYPDALVAPLSAIQRQLNRISTSFTKCRRYPAMIAAIKKRLSGTDLTSKGREYNYRELAHGAAKD